MTQVTGPVVHGEGPHWDPRHQVLYFVDILNQTVSAYDPSDQSLHTIYIGKTIVKSPFLICFRYQGVFELRGNVILFNLKYPSQ